MDIVVLAIGDELLRGFGSNSNACFISRNLTEKGWITQEHLVVGDNLYQIQSVVEGFLKKGACVISTGGLGPTCDDQTRQAIAIVFQTSLVISNDLKAHLIEQHGDLITIEDQASMPQKAQVIPNRIGTASGYIVKDDELFPGGVWIALPGPPQEMHPMFLETVLPWMLSSFSDKKQHISQMLHFNGLYEHQVDPLLRKLQVKYPQLHCGIYPSYGVLSVHLSVEDCSHGSEKNVLNQSIAALRSAFGSFIFESASGKIEEAVHQLLIDNQWTLSVAESCTGGAFSAQFIAMPGASQYFCGGIVAYSNRMKETLLGISKNDIDKQGVVSEYVTCLMAESIQKQSGSYFGIGISGILGPDGAVPGKPVGTICFSIACLGQQTFSNTLHLKGDRESVREKALLLITAQLHRLCLHTKSKNL